MRSLAVLADFASMALAYAGRYVDVRQERDWLDAILAGAEEPVLVTDMAGAILLCNPSARRILGIPVAYYGMAADRLDHEGIKRLLHAKQAKRAQITLDDDCVYNAQMTIIPELGRVIVMQDISHFVEVDRLKTNFVSNVSQDLRSPLTAILGYVELLTRAGSVNAQQQMFIERITLSAQSISHLISDLLDLSRIESSSVGAQAECVPLPLICDYAHAALEGELKARKQRFSLEVADEDASVRGNAQRLKQMLRNLLQNASQYSADGGQIRLRLRTENDLILIEVEDNGIGIPLEDQPHIFEKFYRSNAVRDRFDGAGLGLAIVKSIVDQHHGRIWVESTPGQGSKFTVILPACAG
jgi:signal transduction histidine kinase